MPVPSSVTVALSSDEVRVLREAADVLGVPLERLLAAAAAAFARLCGFRKTATVSIRRSPSWGPQPEPSLPAEILEVPLDADTAAQVESAVGYVRWAGQEGVQPVTFSEYIVGSAMRLVAEKRVEGAPPSFPGLAEQLFGPASPRADSVLHPSLDGTAISPATRHRSPEPAPMAPAPAAPARPAYTLPRADAPAYKPAPRERPTREAVESPSAQRDRPAPSRPVAGRAPPKGKAKGPGAAGAPGRDRPGRPVATANSTPGLLARARKRPLLLAGLGMGLLLLVVLTAAYVAATAPAETAPAAAPEASLSPRTLEPKPPPAAGDALRLEAPADGEAAAAALKRWEDNALTGTNVPAAPASPQKPGKDVDKLLAQRYGRPRVLADASLKPEAYDEDIALAIADVARVYPVPPALVKAVIRRESNFNPNAVSQVGAIGLMQLMPYTAKKVGLRVSDLWVPKTNILGGTRLLSALLQYYDGDVIGALSAYNARPREPLAPLPKNGETPEYVQAVLRFYEEYNGAPLQRQGQSLEAPLRPGR
jgi:soluble lytic murein transglycosylase-like protein